MQYGGETFERLRIPEYIHGFTQDVGKPELPVKGILLDLPENKTATLTVETTETETHAGYWIYPVPDKVADEENGLAQVGEVFAMDEAAYLTDALYPDTVAVLGDTYTFRDQQKLQILFHPLAFNPATGELTHHTLIRVRVEYEDAVQTSGGRAMSRSMSRAAVDGSVKLFVGSNCLMAVGLR